MAKFKINDQEYDSDQISDEAKQNLQMLSVSDAEIKRLQVQLAIAQTARNAYLRALTEAVGSGLPSGDTLKV